MFKPCVVIPVYNHHERIGSIVDYLLVKKLHCYLLDDGSYAACQKTLQELAKKPRVTLLRWEQNRGKGAVVCDGLAKAYSDGYSHAIQIDADGQHNLHDVKLMLAEAKKYQNHVISAARSYRDMPKSRRNGRRVTDIWVWVNTLSFRIKDSMCGFRVYPLDAALALLRNYSVGKRMDFDTDILVRLYWRGIEVRHIATTTVYDEKISSHFDLFKDNIRISRMHAKLFFGMLPRIPSLLARHLNQ